ncbi:hypothetical protein C8Q76DRAFT_854234 [Earliella scabrosa]|nr:hypothetical protein C8Q76DRAFT_854234 [Earliella scabrosa]
MSTKSESDIRSGTIRNIVERTAAADENADEHDPEDLDYERPDGDADEDDEAGEEDGDEGGGAWDSGEDGGSGDEDGHEDGDEDGDSGEDEHNIDDIVRPPGIAPGQRPSDGSVLGMGPTAGGLVPSAGQVSLGTRQTLADQSQMWLVEPLADGVSFRIRNAQSGNVLDVKESDSQDGAWVIVYSQTDNPNQQWTFEWVEDADGSVYYRLNNNSTKKALTLTTDAAKVAVSSTWIDGQQQQLWAFDPVVFPPVYRISHAKTGWYLQYDKNSDSAIATNKIPSSDPSRSQLWFLETTDDGEGYVIRSVESEKKVLDLRGSGMAEGTDIIAWDFHGGKNQQWRIVDLDSSNPDEDRVRIVSVLAHTVAEVVEGPTSGTLQAQRDHGDNTQTWRFLQYPFPSVYWTTLQNLKTGMFLKHSTTTTTTVSPSYGMASALDYSVQWRFIPSRTTPHHYLVVNRASGWVLLARSQSPTVEAGKDKEDQGALWTVEVAGDGIAVVSTRTIGALDHYDGGTTIQAYPNNGTTDPYHRWISVPVSDRLPSFALVNSRTGHSLDFRSATEKPGVIMSTDSTREWSNQWYLDVLAGEEDSSVYAIISKSSGMVLDHWAGERIEAQNDDVVDPHHQWRFIPCACGENYFQIQNVSTSRYLEERVDNVPNATATTPMNPDKPADHDRAQCWELVFARVGEFDLINVDDDVLQRLLPYFQAQDSETLRHRIVKRAPGKEKKGKRKDAHIPQNPRLLRDLSQTVLDIFEHLISEWVEHTLPTTVQAGTRVSTTAREVNTRYRIQVPRALLAGSDRPGWMRIDIQGTYEASPGNRVANIQGQWNNESVFHVIVPLGVRVGAETIRGAMRQSLAQHTTITIAAANSTSPGGGSKPNTTPKPPPGPSGGNGNGWIYLAAAIVPIILLSPLGM